MTSQRMMPAEDVDQDAFSDGLRSVILDSARLGGGAAAARRTNGLPHPVAA